MADIDQVQATPTVLSLTPRRPPTVTTLTLDGKLDSLFLIVHTLAQLDPHAFVRLRSVHVYAHLAAEEVDRIPRDAWAGMDQTLSVLLSLGEITFKNTCKDASHVEAGWDALVGKLPVLEARDLLSLTRQEEVEKVVEAASEFLILGISAIARRLTSTIEPKRSKIYHFGEWLCVLDPLSVWSDRWHVRPTVARWAYYAVVRNPEWTVDIL